MLYRQQPLMSAPSLFLLLLFPLVLLLIHVSAEVAYEGTDDHEVTERQYKPLDPKEEVELLNDKDEETVGISPEGLDYLETYIPGIGSLKDTPTATETSGTSSATSTSSRSSLRAKPGKVCTSSECSRVADMVKSHTNMTADPCTDIDNFVCGGWRSSFELPEDETGWTISFDEIANKTRHTIKSILEQHSCEMVLNQSATNATSSFDNWDALSTCLYESCMDTDSLDSSGAVPMMELLFEGDSSGDRLTWLVDSKFDVEQQSISSKRDLFSDRMFALAKKLQDIHFWGFWVGLNTLDPTKHQTLRVHGSGLGLSYHFYDDKHTDIQSQYREHLANLLSLFDTDLEKYDQQLMMRYTELNPNRRDFTPEMRAMRIYKFELSLRDILLSPEESRDVVKYTKAITYGELKSESHLIDVGRIMEYFMKEGNKTITDDHELLIHQTDYFEKLSEKLQSEDWSVIFDHILVHTISGYAGMLGKPWRSEKEAYNKKRTGAETLPRWRSCRLSPPSWVMSRRYVKEKYDTRRKRVTKDLVADLKKAFRGMLKNYSWMSEDTKDLAKIKLKRMTEKIAYPDWLESDYEEYFQKYYGEPQIALDKIKESYFSSKLHLGRMGTLYELSQLKEPQDMTEWHMNPQSVNAYYSPSMNQIAFMAAILEEPSVFVWSKHGGRAEEMVMRALTYGGIGGIIGHEITHGFDDKGKDYDADGKLSKWWSDGSEANFFENAQCVEEQYNGYSVDLPIEDENGDINNISLNVRGSLTLGENIADNGGVQLAWEALKLKLTDRELNSQPLLQFGVSLTTTQLFMFAWGHFWCSVNRPKSVRRRIETDPHSPDEFRTEGPLSNFGLFAQVFKCPKGSPMNREDVCRVW
eukprot:GHVS01004514.1.p1 GENE.GHVS01004514.1~~GHVS01004514.1.p1  ORF type:complete len:867 (+),score=100.90 GHVS01004514.1:366-2966(+)